MKFTAIVEQAGSNYSAYLPDVPGCVAVGDTREETLANLSDALAIYLDELSLVGEEPPTPSVIAREVEPASAA